MARFIANSVFWSVIDSNGDPGSAWRLYFYETGTTTPKNTYSDTGLTTPNANPVVADSAGRFGDIFLESGTYKVVLKTDADATVATADPVDGGAGNTGAVEAKTADFTVAPGDATKTFVVDASSAAVTVSLPAATTAGDGFEITVKVDSSDASENGVTVDANGSETIDGNASYALTKAGQAATFRSDGSEWWVRNTNPETEAADNAFTGDNTHAGAETFHGPVAVPSTEVTIASGVIAPTGAQHTVDTEGDAATDDLDLIAITNVPDGGFLLLRSENAARTVVVKHDAGTVTGTNKRIFLSDDADFSIDDTDKSILLQRRGDELHEVTRSATGGITLGTEQSASAGSEVDFPSIPSGTKRIVITFEGVSLSGSDNMLIQIGDAGGLETSGYVSGCNQVGSASATSTSGFIVKFGNAVVAMHGTAVLVLSDEANNTWVCMATGYQTIIDNLTWGGGSKSLSAALDRVRVTVTGTDTFDSGFINIAYEG